MLQKIKPVKVAVNPCTCKAYSFPHRSGGGRCQNPGGDFESPRSCGACAFNAGLTPCMHGLDYICSLDQCPWGK